MIRRKRENKKGQVGQGFLQSHQTKEKVQEKKVGENPALPALFILYVLIHNNNILLQFYVH